MNIRNKQKAESKKQKAKSFGLYVVRFFVASIFFVLVACFSKKESENKISAIKSQQYYVRGEKLYFKHCSNCHQKNGTGLGRLFPPVAKSDFIDKNFNEVLCLMRNGKKGELIVNGVGFNQPMPGIPTLSDLEVAELATYLYNNWDRKRGAVTLAEVSATMAACNP
jgi:cytochrome c551